MKTQRLAVGLAALNLVLLTSERPNSTSITLGGAEGQERVIRP